MPRWGEWHRMPDGSMVHVLYSGRRPKQPPCVGCGKPSTLLCDYPGPKGGTCDKPVCRGCGASVGPDRDYCPDHARQSTLRLTEIHEVATPPKDTPGALYDRCMLVRVMCDGDRPFTAGLLIDPETDRVAVAAPILGFLRGQKADQIRRTFARMGWRATIVRRKEA